MKERYLTMRRLFTGLMLIGYSAGILQAQNIDTLDNVSEISAVKQSSEINGGFDDYVLEDISFSVSTIKPDEYLNVDNSLSVSSAIEGKILGVRGSMNIRGLGNALVVIDGIPGRNMNYLNLEEVEQITVLKDANAVALYGPQGRNGVILIKTKNGLPGKNRASVTVNQSLRKPLALPHYIGSVEYMKLYNEARLNDGLSAIYTEDELENYRPDLNPYKYPDIDFYSSDFLKSYNYSTDVVAQFYGGSSNAQYYVNVGWNGDGSLEKLNPEANRGISRFNIRGNVNFRVNKYIKSSVGIYSVINSNRVAHNSVLSQGVNFKPNVYAPIIPGYLIDTIANPLLGGVLNSATTIDGYLLASTQAYKTDAPVSEILGGGYRNYMFRTTQFNNKIEFDLGDILEGLSAETYLSFDFYDAYTVSINNSYAVYEPTWEENKIVDLEKYGTDRKDLTENVSTRDFTSRYGAYAQLKYVHAFGEDHKVRATLLGYNNSTTYLNNNQGDKNSHLGFQVFHKYRNKLISNFSSSLVHSIKLPEGNRNGFSPSVSVGYILSEDEVIKNYSWIDHLKIRASGGVIYSDLSISDYFIYEQTYINPGGYFNWADQYNNKITQVAQGANPNLTFEKRNDLNIGLEGIFVKQLWFELNVFNSHVTDLVTVPVTQYPSFYGDFTPYDNYNAERYYGFESGLRYYKKFNQFSFDIGANVLYTKTKRTQFDEINLYSYQNKEGKPVDAIFGLEDLGFYSNSDFTNDGSLISELPSPSFGDVQPGDIKYKDQNDDHIIDDDDRIMIGVWSNPLSYSLNINIGFKKIDLFVLGIGQQGGNSNLTNDYYWIDGNDKYSVNARERWTEETAEQATFPRLSSTKNNNNYRTSTFWMYNDSYFKIARAQLTYTLDEKQCKRIGMSNLSVNISASNLFELAENKDYRQLNIGTTPQYRNFTLGVRTRF